MKLKRLLALLLAGVLLLGGGVSAGAALPGGEGIAEQSLMNPLPVVTGITAEWNGEILFGRAMYPDFSPDNLTITAHFEDGEPEVLTRWHERGVGVWTGQLSDWWWVVGGGFNPETGTGIASYRDSNGNLVQTTFDFPSNYLELYIEAQQPLTEMKLDEMLTVQTIDWRKPQMLTFTPETSGWYSFENHWLYFSDFARSSIITDSNFVPIYHHEYSTGNNIFSFVVPLVADHTYYIFARNAFHADEAADAQNIILTKYSFAQSIRSMLSHWGALIENWIVVSLSVRSGFIDYGWHLLQMIIFAIAVPLDFLFISLRIYFGVI